MCWTMSREVHVIFDPVQDGFASPHKKLFDLYICKDESILPTPIHKIKNKKPQYVHKNFL